MKTKTDQLATHTLKSVQLFHDSNSNTCMYIIHYSIEHIAFSTEYTLSKTIVILL
jgi:hypothetical protein